MLLCTACLFLAPANNISQAQSHSMGYLGVSLSVRACTLDTGHASDRPQLLPCCAERSGSCETAKPRRLGQQGSRGRRACRASFTRRECSLQRLCTGQRRLSVSWTQPSTARTSCACRSAACLLRCKAIWSMSMTSAAGRHNGDSQRAAEPVPPPSRRRCPKCCCKPSPADCIPC